MFLQGGKGRLGMIQTEGRLLGLAIEMSLGTLSEVTSEEGWGHLTRESSDENGRKRVTRWSRHMEN